jgi:hypothetical protein
MTKCRWITQIGHGDRHLGNLGALGEAALEAATARLLELEQILVEPHTAATPAGGANCASYWGSRFHAQQQRLHVLASGSTREEKEWRVRKGTIVVLKLERECQTKRRDQRGPN